MCSPAIPHLCEAMPQHKGCQKGCWGAHRLLCVRCAKRRLFSTAGSHWSQGPELCTSAPPMRFGMDHACLCRWVQVQVQVQDDLPEAPAQPEGDPENEGLPTATRRLTRSRLERSKRAARGGTPSHRGPTLAEFRGGGSACGVGWGARAVGGSPAQGRQCAAGVGLDGVGEGAAGKAQRGPRSATASRLAPTCFHLKKTGPSGSVGRWCGVLGDVSWLCGGPQGVSCCNRGPARTCFASSLCGACGKTGRAGPALDGGRSRFGPVMHVQGRATGAPHRESVG